MRERAIKAMMTGRLSCSEEGELSYTLKHPLTTDKGDVHLAKLDFKLRYREHELEKNMKGVNPKDFLPMTRAYIATLTGVSRGVLGKMLNSDTKVTQAVYNLFIRGDA